jgi:hypothetical protein
LKGEEVAAHPFIFDKRIQFVKDFISAAGNTYLSLSDQEFLNV